MNFAHPFSAATLVSAAVSVVLPWSMCPMVPTFTCGLLRSNFSLAMSSTPSMFYCVVFVHLPRSLRFAQPRRTSCTRERRRRLKAGSPAVACPRVPKAGADDQNRTGDLVLTKDALCQLSYIGILVMSPDYLRVRS